MKVSVNWVRDLNDKYGCAADPMPDGIDKLVEKIGAQLGAVEEVINLGEKYEGIVVVKVVKCQKHPNADKLSVCLVNDGKAVKNVKRDKDGLVEIVCGAPNARAGMLAAWIPPGNTVPATVDKDPFVIEAREIRGVVSNGMLASPKELELGDSHEGLLVIDEDVKPGTPLTEVYKLDDYIIDIENKMFTHRPDLFGILGVARELAGIQGHKFKSPKWYDPMLPAPKPNGPETHKITFKNEVPKLVPAFCAIAIKEVKIAASPIWLQTYLSRVGIKPINNIVDITNFVMYETAQPIHAYDYDKTLALQRPAASGQRTVKLGARLSRKGEELLLIGGKKLKLEAGAVLITGGDKPIGLGGVMGGAETEVDENTKNIILECANFDMNITRKTAMAYGLFTDAATRFTKAQSLMQNVPVISKAVSDVTNIAGGRAASKLISGSSVAAAESVVRTKLDFINSRLGLSLSAAKIETLLTNVEFRVSIEDQKILLIAPFWRTDIEIPEDVVEEAGRLYGYDHLPLSLPARDLTPPKLNSRIVLKAKIRGILSAGGANEVLTYSFTNEKLLANTGQDKKDAYHVRNALSPDLQYYRLSLTPSLLEKVHPNIKSGFDKFVLYEIGTAHVKGVLDEEKLPRELERLALVLANRDTDKLAGAPFFAAKKQLDYLLNMLSISEIAHEPITKVTSLNKEWQVAAATFESKRLAAVYSGKTFIGLVGEPSQRARQALKLPAATAHAEIDFNVLLELSESASNYQPLNRYPALEQDLCLRTSTKFSYAELTNFLNQQFTAAAKQAGYNYQLEPLDIYQKKKDYKQTTWRITLSHPERTLTTEEANKLLDEIARKAKETLGAERI